MTTRDPQQLLDLFLEEGPAVLPDRVLEAVREDIHRQRQRAVMRPWRFTTMRTYLAAAAVVAVVAIGGGVFLATRGPAPNVGSTPVPSGLPTPAEANGALRPGVTYKLSRMGAAFTFEIPATGPTMVADGVGSRSLRLRPTSLGAITFHDAAALPNNFCHPTGVITRLPGDVQRWLRKGGSDVTVSPTQHLGSVSYWDLTLGPRCYSGEEPPGQPEIYFSAGEHHRVFEIPITGDVSVVAFTWGSGYGGEGDDVLAQLNPLANTLVQSIKPYKR